MASTPTEKLNDLFIDFLDFFLRNIFGFLTTLTGIVYQIYQMSGKTKRMTKMQCVMSVIMWIISSFAIVVGLSGSDMNRMIYGLICWATPLAVKPISDMISIKAGPMAEHLLNALDKFSTEYFKKK